MPPTHPPVRSPLCLLQTFLNVTKHPFGLYLRETGLQRKMQFQTWKLATQNLSVFGTRVFSPAPRELIKKNQKPNCRTVTLKVLNVPIWHFEAFTVFMDI